MASEPKKNLIDPRTRFVALLLCFYLSGAMMLAACLLTSCFAAAAADFSREISAENPESCSMKDHSCCRRKKQSPDEPARDESAASQTKNLTGQPAAIDCCGFRHLPADAVRWQAAPDNEPETAFLPPVRPRFPKAERKNAVLADDYRPVLLDYGGTYLRCRVLLI